ncbi:MAG: cysteine dioxygenase [Pseudomonadota bacterium]
MDRLVAQPRPEPEMLVGTSTLLGELVHHDDWLAEAFTVPHPQFYQQYLLHADPAGRYSVVSFVWGPGQKTPVHDHGVWGVIGMLRGAELSQAYRRGGLGLEADGPEEMLQPGDTAVVSPAVGDIHLVRNAFDDRVSISIHVYGTDIGQQRRHVFDPATGAAKEFVSGYANAKETSA